MNKCGYLAKPEAFLMGGLFLFFGTSVFAADIPRTGMAYNTKEVSSLTYFCQEIEGGLLKCDFTQAAVRKKAKPEDLSAKLEEARKSYEEEKAGMSASDCKLLSDYADMLEGRKPPPNEDGFNAMTDQEKQDLVKTVNALGEFCRTKTLASYLNAVRLSHDRDTRTCRVNSHAFQQTFRFVRDDVSGEGSWVVTGAPEGPCGVVQLSRFEPEKMKDSKLIFWKYIARKAVTNPHGTLFPGMSCKGLDEAEYVYDWRSKTQSVGCDYVEFSPM